MAFVPSLTNQLYLTDPLSIIAYTLRRYQRTPKSTIPILADQIISLAYQIAEFGREPDDLANNIQTDLQTTFDRIFEQERRVTVTVSANKRSVNEYDIVVSIIYVLINGELQQTGTTIQLKNGFPVIPEDRLTWDTNPYKK